MNLFNVISTIGNAIASVAAPKPPDPLRFTEAIAYPPNFHGELVGSKRKSNVNDRVRINFDDGTVEFVDKDPFAGVNIPSELTPADIAWLKKKGLDPGNIAYHKAKVFFAGRPTCDKVELAAASGIGIETAKDVISGFRHNIHTPSPTTERPLF